MAPGLCALVRMRNADRAVGAGCSAMRRRSNVCATRRSAALDIGQGPLIRALAIETPDDGWRLLLAIHHLAVDGVVVAHPAGRPADGLRQQCRAGEPVVLPAKTSSYKEMALALQAYAAAHDEELAFWRSLAGTPVALP